MAVLGRAYGFSPIVASIDDYYLPLPARAAAMAANPFAIDRGPPGSHDLHWLNRSLDDFAAHGQCRIPRFDKGLAGGRGDRSGSTRQKGGFLSAGGLDGGRPPVSGGAGRPPSRRLRPRSRPGAPVAAGCWRTTPARGSGSMGWCWCCPSGGATACGGGSRRRHGSAAGARGPSAGRNWSGLLRCFRASVPPHRALQPAHTPAGGSPPVLMTATLDGRRRVIAVGPPGAVHWPAPAQLSSSSPSSSSMG